jgi:basic membrane protein A
MKTCRIVILSLFVVLLILACTTPPAGSQLTDGGGVAQTGAEGVPRIAVLLTAEDLSGKPFGEEIMIGVSRTAQEFGGTIVGREKPISFGQEIDIRVFPTAFESDAIEQELRSLDPDQYDLVFGCGFMFGQPLARVHRDYPGTHFVCVDSYPTVEDPGDNITFLMFNIRDAAFLAGAVAGDKFGGALLGFIGGMDIPLIREEFLGGFVGGLEYADSLNGTNTELMVDFGNSFGDKAQGYELAMNLYDRGAACIYQAAGETGIGVLEAAGEADRWSIGVDTDQGLQFAQEPFGKWILTSTVKRWGTGVYLVCKEFLLTGSVPVGIHVVGLNQGCVDMAINPYNTPSLLDQLDLIASVRSSLERGEIPSAVGQEETIVWKSQSASSAQKISLAVNDPEFSRGIDVTYRPTLQKALSTAFHESGRYRVINREQKDRLLEEISSSLDITADEKQQLEVGRLIAAEVIVFVDLSKVGDKYILDSKIVDVQTGIAVSAASESFDSIEQVFEGLDLVVRSLGD